MTPDQDANPDRGPYPGAGTGRRSKPGLGSSLSDLAAVAMVLIIVAGLSAVLYAAADPPMGMGDHDVGHDDGLDAGEGATAQIVHVDIRDIRFRPETLTVEAGTTVQWMNHDRVQHTVTPTDKALWGSEGSGDDPADWMDQGDMYAFTFTEPGTYDYYCIPHAYQADDGAWRGMVGTVVVTEASADAIDGGTGSSDVGDHDDGPVGDDAISPARPADVAEIGRSAFDVPPPIARGEPAHVTFNLTSREVVAEVADGRTYTYWTFDGTVPGPMLRVRVGDTVTVNHHNPANNSHVHNIDFHAVTGPGGGAGDLNAAPGETAAITFRVLHPGLFVYHCAAGNVLDHIAMGMYGLILVEPEEGLPAVDREYYVVQSDLYSRFDGAAKGHHEYDLAAAVAEDATWVVFNGRPNSLVGEERRLTAEVGDTVRLYFGVAGPNLVSSFHVIGEHFDRVWDEADLVSLPSRSVQTTLVPAGGATVVDLLVEVPGNYKLVDHSIARVAKGALGILHVEGPGDPTVYRTGG